MSLPGPTRRYLFHGLSLEISSNDPRMLEMVHSRFLPFPSSHAASVDLAIELICVSEVALHVVHRPTGERRPVYDLPGGEVTYFHSEDVLYLDVGDRVRGLCVPSERRIRLSILQTSEANLWLAAHPLLTLPLIELLKRMGRFSLHAAGLCAEGKCILLPGSSGSGKSTLAVALLRGGFGFLGDDMLFIQSEPRGCRLLGFPDELDVADETIAFFPELHSLLDAEKRPGRPKRAVRPEAAYPAELVRECRPAVIVFPRVAHAQRSALRPLTPDAALLELAPNVLLTEASSTQAHLDALAALVGEAACYRLETGRDFEALPALFRDLLR